jgi:hypothetical protein
MPSLSKLLDMTASPDLSKTKELKLRAEKLKPHTIALVDDFLHSHHRPSELIELIKNSADDYQNLAKQILDGGNCIDPMFDWLMIFLIKFKEELYMPQGIEMIDRKRLPFVSFLDKLGESCLMLHDYIIILVCLCFESTNVILEACLFSFYCCTFLVFLAQLATYVYVLYQLAQQALEILITSRHLIPTEAHVQACIERKKKELSNHVKHIESIVKTMDIERGRYGLPSLWQGQKFLAPETSLARLLPILIEIKETRIKAKLELADTDLGFKGKLEVVGGCSNKMLKERVKLGTEIKQTCIRHLESQITSLRDYINEVEFLREHSNQLIDGNMLPSQPQFNHFLASYGQRQSETLVRKRHLQDIMEYENWVLMQEKQLELVRLHLETALMGMEVLIDGEPLPTA